MTDLPPVLLIEDQPESVVLLQYEFKKAAYLNPVYAVETGELGLAYLSASVPFEDRERYPFPGIVVLDWKLPLMSGLEVLQKIRANPVYKSLVVIVLSSSSLPEDMRNAYQAGANSYIVKPLSFYDIVEVIRAFSAPGAEAHAHRFEK